MASILASHKQQRTLSQQIEDHYFMKHQHLQTRHVFDPRQPHAPHASSWLSVTPASGLDLHLDPMSYTQHLRWLGVDTAREASCSLCPDTTLDLLGNHAATCTRGGDMVSCHNHLRDLVLEFCRCAHQVVRVEKGSGLTPDHSHTRPDDILV